MVKIGNRLFALCLMACCLMACGKYHGDKQRETAEGFSEDMTDSSQEWVVFRGDGFSLQFPPIFKLDTSGYQRTSLILYTELTNDGDMYADNIAVVVKERENNMTLEAYGKQSEGFIMQYTESPEIMYSDLKKKDGDHYYELIYSEDQSEFRLIREQRIVFRGNYMYSITLTCEDAVFDQCKDVGEAIMNTFKVE